MTLSVIGAGFGRTGTLSLQGALQMLGLGRCYHMLEVIQNPEHSEIWHKAAEDGAADWDLLFEGYGATVDWPACYFWRQLSSHYPEAKVILTTRDPERWYDSVKNTIYQSMSREPSRSETETLKRRLMARDIILQRTFNGRFEDRAHAIDVFNNHVADVQRAIAPERLLTFQVADGWAPLCHFLDLPIPDEPFPNVNSTADFLARVNPPKE